MGLLCFCVISNGFSLKFVYFYWILCESQWLSCNNRVTHVGKWDLWLVLTHFFSILFGVCPKEKIGVGLGLIKDQEMK